MRWGGGLASRPGQRLQLGVWGGQPLWVQGGCLLGMGVRSWSHRSLAGGLGGRGGALWRDCSDRGRGPWRGKLRASWRGRGSWSSPAGSLQSRGLGLQHLLLGRGVRVTLVVLRAGDAGGCTAIVLVDVFGVTAALIVDTAAVRTLSLTFRRRVGPADLLGPEKGGWELEWSRPFPTPRGRCLAGADRAAGMALRPRGPTLTPPLWGPLSPLAWERGRCHRPQGKSAGDFSRGTGCQL